MSDERGEKISLVAVVRIDPDRPVSDLDRFIALALPSFRRWIATDMVEELILVVPPADIDEAVHRVAVASPFPLRVVDETTLLTSLPPDLPGWTRQQLIKLALASTVRTPWFVLLDADVVAARPLDIAFLLPAGRGIWQQEEAGAHLDWWRVSAEVLGLSFGVEPTDEVFGVTPAVMHTASLADVACKISEAHPHLHWTDTLAGIPGWTEYSLYWTYLLSCGLAEKLYAMTDRRPYALESSIWTPEQVMTRGSQERLANAFREDAPHAFVVVQSNLELPLEDVVSLLRPHIEGTTATTAAERAAWRAHRTRFERRRVWHRARGAGARLLRGR